MIWLLTVFAILTLIFFCSLMYCFFSAFYVFSFKKKIAKECELPPGKIYLPYKEQMLTWMKETRKMPHTVYSVTSFDGLKLYGKYYEFKKGAPLEIMFHGYRGNSERDLCGAVERTFSLGRNALVVDQRAAGMSDGHIITFGVKESQDCLKWIELAINEFGADVKIILTGISMGAATVTVASGYDLPPNVVGILADCGFTSAKDIIKKVIRDRHLSPKIFYPLVRLSARLFGGFDPEEVSSLQSCSVTKIPTIFIHGDNDRYVPYEMSVRNFNACTGTKKLFTVKGAGHGLAYLVDREGYIKTVSEFFSYVK